MKIVGSCLMTALVFGLPFAASAQQSGADRRDIKYCNALAKSYQTLWPLQEGMPVGDVVALSRCDTEPKPVIAMLEETRRQEDRPAARRQGGAAAGLNEQYA